MNDAIPTADRDLRHRGTPQATPASGPAVPWLEGALFRYLSAGAVLDIKAPGDPHGGPIVPGATVLTLAAETLAAPDARRPAAKWYDAVFVGAALATAAYPQTMLAAWFWTVRPGGHLVVALAGDIPDELIQMVESALPVDSFRVIHLDVAAARGSHADFSAPENMAPASETRLVLRRLIRAPLRPGPATPALAVSRPDPQGPDLMVAPVAEAAIPFALARPGRLTTPGMRTDTGLLIRDFAPRHACITRVLVLKLDRDSDFIIGLPALRDLRQTFPDAYIRLVCGHWNVASACAAGLFDEVRAFDFFSKLASDWNGTVPGSDWRLFAVATEGHFDLAIDLHVDEDTRALLARVDADLRCGIGSRARFPMLDIALPDTSREVIRQGEAPLEDTLLDPAGSAILGLDAFESAMEVKKPFRHETSFVPHDPWLLRSEPLVLPLGRYRAEFGLSVRRFLPGISGVGVGIEVVADGEHKVASSVFGRRSLFRLDARRATLLFESVPDISQYEFRVLIFGKALSGRLRFTGIQLRRLGPPSPRFRPSELHVGEKLSLLVSLIRQRTLPLAPTTDTAAAAPGSPLQIVVAPFSDSTVRDWPFAHYAALIRLLVEQLDCQVRVIGAPAQAKQAAALMDLLRDGVAAGRVSNAAGMTQWSEVPAVVKAADLVICNNSGIAHQAASLGARTLAIYSASHQPQEWGPRGSRSRAIMMDVQCSPCGWERIEDCSNEHRCMQMITPELVVNQVKRLLVGEGP